MHLPGIKWKRPRVVFSAVSLGFTAMAVFVVVTWPLIATTGGRLTLICLSFFLQALGAGLVIKNVLSQDKRDRQFLRGLADIDDIRKTQAANLQESFGQPPPTPPRPEPPVSADETYRAQLRTRNDAMSAYVRDTNAPLPLTPRGRQQEMIRRIGRQPAIQALAKFSAENLGEVLPKTHETVTHYLKASASATTVDRWIGVVFLVLGLIVGLLSGVVGTLA